ncbi:hypothetical protein GCM10023145_37140 [Angustibacter luteus]
MVALSQSNPDGDFPSIASAVSQLATPSVGGALVLAFAVVFSTVMTQAFEFEMIKLLEGYWTDRWWARQLRRRRVTSLKVEGAEVRKLAKRLERRTRKSSFGKLAGGDKALKRRLKGRVRLRAGANEAPPDPEADYLLMHWRTAAEPAALRRLESVEREARNFPAAHRTMATRLGNTLRAREDRMKLADGGDLEGFILRNYERIPERLTVQVSDFRTRLNMYCTLVLAWILLTMAGIAATLTYSGLFHVTTIVTVAVCLLLARMSYAAATSSAKGYGAALLAADEHVARVIAKTESKPMESSGVAGRAPDE